MQNLAPIALFVYNRPEHTRSTLEYLKKNVLADESRLFIFSDAAKTESDKIKVDDVRHLIKDVSGFKSVKVIIQKQNKGLANSIIDGVTQLINEYGKVIVFEDDLLSSEYTLQFLNEALEKYANEEKVMHIGAYMYNLAEKEELPETFFSMIATSWGWATWARAWKYFEPDINKLLPQFDHKKKMEFSFNKKMNFYDQMKELRDGKNNSWAIRWYASIYLKGGLSLNPTKSLINNIGFDWSGTHSNNEEVYQVEIAKKPISKFPPKIEKNNEAYKAMEGFLKERKGDFWPRVGRYKSKIMKLVQKTFASMFDKKIK